MYDGRLTPDRVHSLTEIDSCLSQNHSFKPLNMTEATLQSLIVGHKVDTKFIDVVSSFYQKVLTIEESFCVPLQVVKSAQCLGTEFTQHHCKNYTNVRRIHVCVQVSGEDEQRYR